MTAQQKELQEKVKTFLDVESLSPEHQAGFVYQLALLEMYDQLSPDMQKVADSYLNTDYPKRQNTIQSPLGKFLLHYDTINTDSSSHAVPLEDISENGIPDFIDSAAVFLDYAWQQEIDVLGFQPPLDTLGKPVEHYNIYFSNRARGEYGLTTFVDEISVLPGDNFTSFIELDNTFQDGHFTPGLDGLRVTCAHEFNHAIQLGYNFRQGDTYIFELTATWIEDVLYPEVNDYFQYLPTFFNTVQNRNFTTNIFPNLYANGIFMQMLSAQYNTDIVTDIWDRIKTEKAIDAIDTELKIRGSSFSESLNDYGKWMYFTGERAIPGEFFDDADEFPQISVLNSMSGNLKVELVTNVRSESFYYISIDTILQTGGFATVSSNENNSQILVNHFNSNNLLSESVVSGLKQPVFLDFVPQDIIFLVSNSRDSTVVVNFTFNPDSTLKPLDESKVVFGPNPVKVEKGLSYFYSVPANSKIKILDLNHHPIRTLHSEVFDNIPVRWDLRDKNDRPLSSGIYYFVVISPDKKQVGKIAVIR